MGIKISNIEPRKETTTSKSEIDTILKKEIRLFNNGFSGKKKERFYTELSVLLKSGINLKHALDLMAHSGNNKDKAILESINAKVTRGSRFSEAINDSKMFSNYESRVIQIGEDTGNLAIVSEDLSDYYQKKNDQKREVISALTYPIIVLFTALIVVFFMLKYVVPMFKDIFEQNRVELPLLTQVIVYCAEFLKDNGIVLGVGIILIMAIVYFIRNKIFFKRIISQILLKIPILGNYLKKIYLLRFTNTMMLLTRSKVPMISGIAMVKGIIGFYPLEKALNQIEVDILQGMKMSNSFQKHPIFEKKIVALLEVAEETNQTEFVFKKLNDQFSKEVEYQSKNLTNILNPLLTLFIGFLVAIILIAMYLPMFRLSTVIG